MKKSLILLSLYTYLLAGPTFNEVSKVVPTTYKLGVEQPDDKTTIIYNCKKDIGVVAEVLNYPNSTEYKVIWTNVRNGNVEVLQCYDYNYWSKHSNVLEDRK